VYGLRLSSGIPLPCREQNWTGPPDVTLFSADDRFFSRTCPHSRSASDDWFVHMGLPNGGDYLRWNGLFEFFVARDGSRIACRALNGSSRQAFQVYLVSHVVSFALLKQGAEPLHATVVVIKNRAVGFIGSCGYGKSTLAASFLRIGHQLLTDDLLVVKHPDLSNGRLLAQPGPARIKLFPEAAKALLCRNFRGVPMNPSTDKLVIPLSIESAAARPVPLKALYILNPPKSSKHDRVQIRVLNERQACLSLIENTFNTIVVSPERLRQQFDFAAALARRVPIKAISYPRRLQCLSEVTNAIVCDIS
jgi:hypothetical protein